MFIEPLDVIAREWKAKSQTEGDALFEHITQAHTFANSVQMILIDLL
jgi:hypothetical protein